MTLSSHDGPHRGLADSKIIGDCLLGFTIGDSLTHGVGIDVEKRFVVRGVTALSHGIQLVIQARSEEQVGGIDAVSHVAGMAHVEASGYRPVRQLPRDSMNGDVPSVPRRLPVAVGPSALCPQPAIASAVDAGPEVSEETLASPSVVHPETLTPFYAVTA